MPGYRSGPYISTHYEVEIDAVDGNLYTFKTIDEAEARQEASKRRHEGGYTSLTKVTREILYDDHKEIGSL